MLRQVECSQGHMWGCSLMKVGIGGAICCLASTRAGSTPGRFGVVSWMDGDKQFFAALSFTVFEYFVDQHPMARAALESDVRIVHFEFLSASQLRIGTLSRMLGRSRGPF